MGVIEKVGLLALLAISALALLALAMPGLVILGFFMLILPGLILALSPAVALYGWLFAVPYGALRSAGLPWWGAVLPALLGPWVFGFGLPAQSNADSRVNLARAVATDMHPTRPLLIGGTVALVRERHQRDNGCDDLCLRLLYNRNAKIVFIGQRGRPGSAFTIERRAVCPPFVFSQDGLKWHTWPSPQQGKRFSWPPPPGLKEVVEARVAGGECLVPVRGPIRPDWTIARTAFPREPNGQHWSIAPQAAQGERITVYRRDGSVMRTVGRFTNAYAAILSLPLRPEFGGSFENSRFAWGRTIVGESRWDWDSVRALRSLVAFNADLPEGTSPTRLRELLATALSDPRRTRDDAGLLLANSVMVDIARTAPRPGDAALLARAIADDRFTKIEPRYEIAKQLGPDYATIVDSAIARLGRLPASDPTTFPARSLTMIIAQMPATWFASPPSKLSDLLRDPVIAARSEAIIDKLDAGGAAAVRLLTEIMTLGAERVSAIEDKGYARNGATNGMQAAVAALCRIGPPARSALDPIIAAKQKLIGTAERWPDPNPGKYSALWRGRKVNDGFVITLVSFGVPITAFRAPDQPSSTVNGSWQAMILSGVKRNICKL